MKNACTEIQYSLNGHPLSLDDGFVLSDYPPCQIYQPFAQLFVQANSPPRPTMAGGQIYHPLFSVAAAAYIVLTAPSY